VGLSGVRPGSAGAFAGPLEQPSSLSNVDASPLFGLRALPNQSPIDAMRNDPLYATSGDLRVANDKALQQMRDEVNNAGLGKTGEKEMKNWKRIKRMKRITKESVKIWKEKEKVKG